MTIEGTLAVPPSSNATLVGTITNRGTIAMQGTNVASSLRIRDAVTLNGGGTLTMSDVDNNFINLAAGADAATARLVNVDNTIRGAGRITGIDFTNGGTLLVDQTTRLLVDVPGSTNSLWSNSGTVQIAGGSRLQLGGNDILNSTGLITGSGEIVGSVINGGNLAPRRRRHRHPDDFRRPTRKTRTANSRFRSLARPTTAATMCWPSAATAPI